MPLTWPTQAAWQALAAPLRGVLEPALQRLDLKPAVLPPIVAARPGDGRLVDGAIALDPALLGPGLRHPDDQDWARRHPDLAELALDRWRRAAGLVLEGVALAGLRENIGADLPDTWWTLGPAADAVDRAAPELGWLWPEAVGLLCSPQLGLVARPRRAAWLWRWATGSDLEGGRGLSPGERPELDDAVWAAFGRWLWDPEHGPAVRLPVPMDPLRPSAEPPQSLPALSHQRVRVEPGPAGASLSWQGGRVDLAGDTAVGVVIGSVLGGPLHVRRQPVLPLGCWVLTGGTADERAGAARGIELELHPNGRLDMVFADAFAGPPTPYLLGLASQIGVSGSGTGRFAVTQARGPAQGTVVFSSLDPGLLSVHPRFSGRFSLPAETILGPVHRVLGAMVGVPWSFELVDQELHLSARLMGMKTVLRLVRPA